MRDRTAGSKEVLTDEVIDKVDLTITLTDEGWAWCRGV